MKKYLIYSLFLAAAATGLTACSSDDKPGSESVITVDQQILTTPFDLWLEKNYTNTYNIQLKYRYEDIEADHDYYTIPADYEASIKLANIIKYCCLEAYDEIAGIEFTRTNFPKLIYFVGNPQRTNNGAEIRGTAEGGKKILITKVNWVDDYIVSTDELNGSYMKTIHHEFAHILNQTSDYPDDFKLITPTGYVGSDWSSNTYDTGYEQRGFVTAYSQDEDREDFVEIYAIYITRTEDQWNQIIEAAGEEGAALINAKLDMVRTYMQDIWGIDMDQMRRIVLRRENDIVTGRVDITDISI